jgi:ribose transport system substrate-binding protein
MHLLARNIVGISIALAAAAVVSTRADAKELTFGYIVASLQIPYNVVTAKGFEDAAHEAGVKVSIIDPGGDPGRQAKAVEDLIAQGVDGIGFLPVDSILAQSFADESAARGIPVVAIAVQVGDPTARKLRDVYPKLTALVTTDDVAIGQRAGDLSASLLSHEKTSQIGIVEGAKGYASVAQRTEGFRTALDAAGIRYEIASSQPTDWTPDTGEIVCRDMLSSHPDLDLIFSHADPMAIGCARAIKATGANVRLVATGGGSNEGNSAIAAAAMDGSVCTRPDLLGRLMLKVLYEAATNPNVQKAQFITYDSAVITKDTLQNCPAEW